MRNAILAFALLIGLPVSAARAETLDNESIILLVKAGVGEDAILAKIKQSPGQYEISVQDLIRLRKANVPSRLITAMIEATTIKPNVTNVAWSTDSRDPMIPHPPGVYVLTDRSEAAKMIAITPTTSRQTKSGGFWSYALTGGIVSMSFKAIVPGAHARTQSTQTKPIFYFYFGQNGQSTPSMFTMSDTITIPTEFSLVRFEVKKDHREKKVGTYNITGVKSGLAEKDRIPFTYSLLSHGVYEVIPVIDLLPGEYGFVIDPTASSSLTIAGVGRFNTKVFDFSVKDRSAP